MINKTHEFFQQKTIFPQIVPLDTYNEDGFDNPVENFLKARREVLIVVQNEKETKEKTFLKNVCTDTENRVLPNLQETNRQKNDVSSINVRKN